VTLFLELLGVAALILLNAFFVAGEYALVTARRTKIQELADQGSRRARAVRQIVADPPRFIAAMQLGVTLTSLGIGALGEQALAHALDPYLATILAVVIAFLIITYLHVVVGELVPKAVALRYPERIALGVSAAVRGFFVLAYPLIWILQRSTELILRALGLESPGDEREALSEAELRMLLGRATEYGEIEREEQEMLYKVFDFADKEVADVMVPRPEVVALSIDLPPEESLAAVIESPYTRYPVYRETLDDIVGILHVRDLFSALNDQGFANVRIEELLRPAYIVPETKDLAALLADFRRSRICSRRLSGRSRTSSTFPTSRSSRSTRRLCGSTGPSRSTISTRSSESSSPPRTTTRSRASSSVCSAGQPPKATRSSTTAFASTCWRSRARGSKSSRCSSSSRRRESRRTISLRSAPRPKAEP
jgi:CBS domain containing-hemolysin-like protein